VLELDIHKQAGVSFNIGSPKQLGEVLFDKLGLPGGKKGQDGGLFHHSDIPSRVRTGHDIVGKILIGARWQTKINLCGFFARTD